MKNDIELCRYCTDSTPLIECEVSDHWEKRLKACNLPTHSTASNPPRSFVEVDVEGEIVRTERLIPLTGVHEDNPAPADKCVYRHGVDPKVLAVMEAQIRDAVRLIYRAPNLGNFSIHTTGINKGAIADRNYELALALVSVDKSVHPERTYENYVAFHNSVMFAESPEALTYEKWAAAGERTHV